MRDYADFASRIAAGLLSVALSAGLAIVGLLAVFAAFGGGALTPDPAPPSAQALLTLAIVLAIWIALQIAIVGMWRALRSLCDQAFPP